VEEVERLLSWVMEMEGRYGCVVTVGFSYGEIEVIVC
jgi:hypothetical protein